MGERKIIGTAKSQVQRREGSACGASRYDLAGRAALGVRARVSRRASSRRARSVRPRASAAWFTAAGTVPRRVPWRARAAAHLGSSAVPDRCVPPRPSAGRPAPSTIPGPRHRMPPRRRRPPPAGPAASSSRAADPAAGIRAPRRRPLPRAGRPVRPARTGEEVGASPEQNRRYAGEPRRPELRPTPVPAASAVRDRCGAGPVEPTTAHGPRFMPAPVRFQRRFQRRLRQTWPCTTSPKRSAAGSSASRTNPSRS